jgi:hypothetical protein
MSAETSAAITLAGASLLNLGCLMFLLGWVPRVDRPLLWISVFVVLFILERCHLAAIRGWLRGVERPSEESRFRARVSSAYIWSSLVQLSPRSITSSFADRRHPHPCRHIHSPPVSAARPSSASFCRCASSE